MPKIKSAAEIAEKYGRVTPARSADYEAGVKNPTKDWEANTKASAASFAQGVQEAVSRGAFEKGVAAAGNAKWSRKATTVGVGRWGTGIQAGKQDFAAGFEPFRNVIESTALPPRFPKGSPQNLDRVRVLATALHDAKVR